MPLLLIGVRESRWLKSDAKIFLERDDVPADPVADLRVSENMLSVWEIEPDKANLERVIRALVVGGERVSDRGYVLFDAAILDKAGIKAPVHNAGKTLDKGINSCHRDLVDLSGNQLVKLVKGILEGGESGRVLKKRLLELIDAGVEAKELPENLRDRFTKRQ
jgi:hypothetical protein